MRIDLVKRVNVLVVLVVYTLLLSGCGAIPKPPEDSIASYDVSKPLVRNGKNVADATFSGKRRFVLYPNADSTDCASTNASDVVFSKTGSAWARLDLKLANGLRKGETLSLTLLHVVGGRISQQWDLLLSNETEVKKFKFQFLFGARSTVPDYNWGNADPIGGVWQLTPVDSDGIGGTVTLHAEASVKHIEKVCPFSP